MVCANPDCRRDAHDLQNGTLRLMEMDVPPEERLEGNDFGFPICKVPSRFFWLCAACSTALRMSRWTAAGLILEPQQEKTSRETIDHRAESGEPSPLMDIALQTLA